MIDLSNFKTGDRVVFSTSWDIFPVMIVPQGTEGTVVSNELPRGLLCIKPDSSEMKQKLFENYETENIEMSSDDFEFYDFDPIHLKKVTS